MDAEVRATQEQLPSGDPVVDFIATAGFPLCEDDDSLRNIKLQVLF
jgi:hypothetical protein